MKTSEIVLKVTSLCNLNCSYCYVFNKGDTSFLTEPKIISDDVINELLLKIDIHCKKQCISNFLIIFHGGEPLLLGKQFYINFVTKVNNTINSTNIQYSLQTNGTLLNNAWVELLTDLNIQTCISLDGHETASSNRVYKNSNQNSFQDVVKGLKLLQAKQKHTSILSVINITEDPRELYAYFKSLDLYCYDLLFPDATYDKPEPSINKIGNWLIEFYDIYNSDKDKDKPRIKLFELIEGLLLGLDIGNEHLGNKLNSVITIKSNGNIEAVDSLKICRNGITNSELNIFKNNIDDALNEDLIKFYYNAHQDDYLCEKCVNCLIKHLCGGSQLSHRYSKETGFMNPSVYCNDIRILIIYIQNKMYYKFPKLKEYGMELLVHEDFTD